LLGQNVAGSKCRRVEMSPGQNVAKFLNLICWVKRD